MGNSSPISGRGADESHVTGNIASDRDEWEHRPVVSELANSDSEAEAPNRKSYTVRRAPVQSVSYNNTKIRLPLGSTHYC